MSNFVVPQVTILLLLSSCKAQHCTKYLCRNKVNADGTVQSYFGGESATNSILNITTLLENTTAESTVSCVKKCIAHEECFSINAGTVNNKTGRGKDVECHLMKENFYANQSSLVSKEAWIHVSVKHSGCDSSSCGTGITCIPNYNDGSYSCVFYHKDVTCKFMIGDGIGGTEIYIGYKETVAQCIEDCIATKATYPDINGVTILQTGQVACYCERQMTGSNGSGHYKACYI